MVRLDRMVMMVFSIGVLLALSGCGSDTSKPIVPQGTYAAEINGPWLFTGNANITVNSPTSVDVTLDAVQPVYNCIGTFAAQVFTGTFTTSPGGVRPLVR